MVTGVFTGLLIDGVGFVGSSDFYSVMSLLILVFSFKLNWYLKLNMMFIFVKIIEYLKGKWTSYRAACIFAKQSTPILYLPSLLFENFPLFFNYNHPAYLHSWAQNQHLTYLARIHLWHHTSRLIDYSNCGRQHENKGYGCLKVRCWCHSSDCFYLSVMFHPVFPNVFFIVFIRIGM